jgi:hypothetical protein
MRITRWAAALAVAAAFALPSVSQAGAQDFVLVNGTGYTIAEVYVSTTRTNDWEEDVLGQSVLGDGGRATIRFDRSEDSCLWDMKVVFADGDSAEWTGFNLCELSVMAISYDDDTGETSAEYE